MTGHGWLTLAVVIIMIAGLVRFEHAADVIFLGALMLLTIAGVITPSAALDGFRNEGMLIIAALFVVAAGLVETGFMRKVAEWVMPRRNDSHAALRRIVPLSTGLSGFLNNTTEVAMVMPALLEWCRKRGVAPSRLLLPLSYASLLGGVCTLIGTSTNLVVHGLMQQSDDIRLSDGLGMWEIGKIGVPIAIVGALYLIFVVPRLLPDRKEFLEQLGESRREFLAEVLVDSSCPLVGQTVQEAGLRGLPGLFLIDIERDEHLISAVAPDDRLHAGDRLIFTGIVSTIVDLQKTPGLLAAADTTFDLRPTGDDPRRLCEAVISTSSPLVGRGIREANFRTIYDAAVVAVHRNGARLRQKIGDVILRPGDTLLLDTGPGFVRAHRNNPDFYLVSEVGESEPIRHHRAWLAAGIAIALVALLTMPELLRLAGGMASTDMRNVSRWFSERAVVFAMLAAGAMVVTRCISANAARRGIDMRVLLVIAAGMGVGKAVETSGAAGWIADHTIQWMHGSGRIGLIAAVYGLTWLLTELMSNNAAAALMFPIAVASANQAGADPRAFVITVCVAASAGFVFPAGYQTHLMVFGPGGYRLADFVKAGIPMVLIWFVLSVIIIPYAWR